MSLLDISDHVGMQVHGEVAHWLVSCGELRDDLLEVVHKGNGGLNLTRTLTGGAGLLGRYDGSLTDSLSGNLHEPKLAQREYLVCGSITGHKLYHMLVELLIVRSLIHIDEVYHNNPSQISQTYLTCYEVCDSHIDIKGCLLLS